MLWPKKIHTRNLITKKNSCGSKILLPPPHNFSNGPSLMSRLRPVNAYFLPPFPVLVIIDDLFFIACVASGSARVRRENWNESKKRNGETLASQAIF